MYELPFKEWGGFVAPHVLSTVGTSLRVLLIYDFGRGDSGGSLIFYRKTYIYEYIDEIFTQVFFIKAVC